MPYLILAAALLGPYGPASGLGLHRSNTDEIATGPFTSHTSSRIAWKRIATEVHPFHVDSLLRDGFHFGEDSIDWLERTNCIDNSMTDGHATEPEKELVFIHIPRTGGTTIEDCSKKQEEQWGHANPNIRGLTSIGDLPAKCYKQHVPPSFLPDIYSQKETFCAVRNPYSRMISQFGYIAAMFGKVNCTRESLNAKLLADLTDVRNGKAFWSDCHYLPQVDYVYQTNASWRDFAGGSRPVLSVRIEEPRACSHVLHTERLEEEFNRLMESNGYPYRLSRDDVSWTKSPSECGAFKVEDLSAEVRHLIEEVYAQDFEVLGYARYGVKGYGIGHMRMW